jgi:hypothetical protein
MAPLGPFVFYPLVAGFSVLGKANKAQGDLSVLSRKGEPTLIARMVKA